MELNAKLNREKEENKNINKKNNKESDAKNKILILGILILIVSGLFLSIGLNANNMDYALSQRIPKLLSIILTGVCISISTTIFQTITGNKILTPNVMGLDSLYVLIQTVIVFVLGSSSIFIVNKKYNFIICVGGMILLSSLLYKMMFKKENEKADICISHAKYIAEKYGINFTFDTDASHYIAVEDDEVTLEEAGILTDNPVSQDDANSESEGL